ncbi:MAG: Holliday junction resolvase RuvX [Chloroflexota bacterium]|nr:Holliday junction resolvase RuvX [Chloroflexota bacterium]
MRRLLGIDVGERRLGLAVADEPDGRAFPLATITRSREIEPEVAALARVVAEQGITEIVVGLPLEASGAEGPQAALTRAWVEGVASRLGLPIAMRDERLSSHLAEVRVGPMKRGRSGGPPTPSQRLSYRSRIDREAAAIILQDELDARAARESAPARDGRTTSDEMESSG